MTLLTKIGKVEAPASASAVTVSDVGFQPKALLFWGTTRTSDGVFGALAMTIGFTASATSADHMAIGTGGDDAAATSNVANTQGAFVARMTTSSATASVVAAEITAISSTGFTIDFTLTTSGADIYYLALGGDSLTNAKSGQFGKKTSTGSQSVTGIGFQPTCVLFLHSALSSGGRASDAFMHFGAAKSNTERWTLSTDSNDGQAAGDADRYFSSSNVLSRNSDTGTVLNLADLTSLDSDGFTINWSSANATAEDIGFLALQGVDVKIGTLTVPASTGIQSISGLSFRPSAIILAGINSTTTGSVVTDWSLSFGAAVSTTERAAVYTGDQNTADPTVTKTASHNDRAYVSYSQASSPSIVNSADLSAFNATSVDLNWTAVSGQPTYGYIILGPGQGPIESGAAALSASSGGSAAGVDTRGASASPSASGTSTVAATMTRQGSATPDSGGTLIANGALTSPASVALTASGTLVSSSTADVPAASVISASGDFGGAGGVIRGGETSISASGTLAADATIIQASGDIFAASSLSASSGGTVTSTVTTNAAPTLTATSGLIIDGFIEYGAISDLTSTSEAITVENVVRNVDADHSASGSLLADAVMTISGEAEIFAQADVSASAIDDRGGASTLSSSGTLSSSAVRTRAAVAAVAGNTNFVANIPSGFEEFGFAQFTATATLTISGLDVPFQEFEQTTISKRADLLDALFRRLDSRVDDILYRHQDAVPIFTSSAIGIDEESILRVYATVVTNFTTDTVTITPLDIATLSQAQLDEWPNAIVI